MRFFFDFVEGSTSMRDREGHELDCPDAARIEALRVLPEVLLSDLRDADEREIACHVRDEHGSILYSASVTLKAQRSPNL